MQEIMLVAKRSLEPVRPAPLYKEYPYSLLGATATYVFSGSVLYFIPWKLTSGMLDLHTQNGETIGIQVVSLLFGYALLALIIQRITILVGMRNKNIDLLFARVPLSIILSLSLGMSITNQFIDRKYPSSILLTLMLIYTLIGLSFWVHKPARLSRRHVVSISPLTIDKTESSKN